MFTKSIIFFCRVYVSMLPYKSKISRSEYNDRGTPKGIWIPENSPKADTTIQSYKSKRAGDPTVRRRHWHHCNGHLSHLYCCSVRYPSLPRACFDVHVGSTAIIISATTCHILLPKSTFWHTHKLHFLI